jgi:subtilisin family serine protease
VFRPQPDGSLAAEERWPLSGYGETRDTLPRPAWQRGLPACQAFKSKTTSGLVLRIRSPSCDFRSVPDVTATADGVLEYEIPAKQHRTPGWFLGGGTSLSSPLWAGLIALADQELERDGQAPMGIDELHDVLYRGWVSGGLEDIGDRGWDTRTGWGSPKAGIVDALARAIERYRASR